MIGVQVGVQNPYGHLTWGGGGLIFLHFLFKWNPHFCEFSVNFLYVGIKFVHQSFL